MIKIIIKDGESFDRMIKRFSNHVKNKGLLKKFRKGRYFEQKPSKRLVRNSAVKRAEYRGIAEKNKYLN